MRRVHTRAQGSCSESRHISSYEIGQCNPILDGIWFLEFSVYCSLFSTNLRYFKELQPASRCIIRNIYYVQFSRRPLFFCKVQSHKFENLLKKIHKN